MGWELQHLKAKHKAMIDLHLAGASNVKIAEEMDCTDVSVGMVLRSPIVQEEIARRRSSMSQSVDEAYVDQMKETASILAEASPKAARVLSKQVDHEDPRIAANACKQILEHTFLDTKERTTVIQISADKVQLLQQTLQEVS